MSPKQQAQGFPGTPMAEQQRMSEKKGEEHSPRKADLERDQFLSTERERQARRELRAERGEEVQKPRMPRAEESES